MSKATFNSILGDLFAETLASVKEQRQEQRQVGLKLGYEGPFLGAQLDLTTNANDECITFSVSYVAKGETTATRIGLATRTFPARRTVADIEPWIEKLTTEIFGDIMGADVVPDDVYLAFTGDQGGNVVNACKNLGVPVLKCNAHRLNSATMWALGVNGTVNTCENLTMEKPMKRLAALVGLFSHSAVNNDELKAIQTLMEEFLEIYALVRRNDTRWTTQHAMMVRSLVVKAAIVEYFRKHGSSPRKPTTPEWRITNEVCSLLDVVAGVTVKIQGSSDTHISQIMSNMREIKEIFEGSEHEIRTADHPYNSDDAVEETQTVDDLSLEAQTVWTVMLETLKKKELGHARMPLERICALLDPRRKDCSTDHLVNGSAALKDLAIDDVKSIAKAFVDLVQSTSAAEDGGSGGGGGGSAEPAPKKHKGVSALDLRRMERLAKSQASNAATRAAQRGPAGPKRCAVIERELRMYVAEDVQPEVDNFSLLRFWDREATTSTSSVTGKIEPGLPYLVLIACLHHGIESTSCQAERNFSVLSFLIGDLHSSMLPLKVERMVFLRLNRLFIPEVKALPPSKPTKQLQRGANRKSLMWRLPQRTRLRRSSFEFLYLT